MDTKARGCRSRWTMGSMAVALALSGCGAEPSTADDGVTGSIAQAIQSGETDTTDRYAVGLCLGGRSSCAAVCSGVLIAPNLVVTARHCIDETPPRIDCSTLPRFGSRRFEAVDVTTAHQMFGGSVQRSWSATRAIVVPSDDLVCGNDIALLVLGDVITGIEPAVPGVQYSIHDERYTRAFASIGYGATSPGTSGAGTRRILRGVPITCASDDPRERCAMKLSPKEFVAGDGMCPGDSGSGAFEAQSFEAGSPVTLGVLSRGGRSQDGTRCEQSAYTRLDAHRQLVVDAATLASKNWTLYPAPVWTTYVARVEASSHEPAAAPATQRAVGGACADPTGDLCARAEEDPALSSERISDPSATPSSFRCSVGHASSPASSVGFVLLAIFVRRWRRLTGQRRGRARGARGRTS